MGSFAPGQKLFLYVFQISNKTFDNRCQLISDWCLPFEYQCKQVANFFGANTSVRLVPQSLGPMISGLLSFLLCSTVRVPVNLMVENHKPRQCLLLGHITVLLKSSHFHGLFIWGLYGLSPACIFHLILHFSTSYELGYFLTRVFIHL